MTIDAERLRALESTEDFLEHLAYRQENGKYQLTKISEIRKLARLLLRHFPQRWWIEQKLESAPSYKLKDLDTGEYVRIVQTEEEAD